MANDKQMLLQAAERLGVPAVTVFLLMVGMFMLLEPVSEAMVVNIATQTEAQIELKVHTIAQTAILTEMAMDARETRNIVQLDRDEKKGETLLRIETAIGNIGRLR